MNTESLIIAAIAILLVAFMSIHRIGWKQGVAFCEKHHEVPDAIPDNAIFGERYYLEHQIWEKHEKWAVMPIKCTGHYYAFAHREDAVKLLQILEAEGRD